jgi:hypothetical protein
MMTTLSAMRRRLTIGTAIIGLALALLGGCSALKLAYSNGSQLAWWWLDGYFDFDDSQSARVKDAIDGFFAWHRASEAEPTAALLESIADRALEPTTPAAVCRWQQQLRERLDPALDRALALFAEQVPMLGEPQLRQLESKFEKNEQKVRRDFLQPDRAERAEAALKRTVERVEQFYGGLSQPQRQVIAAGLAASPFDAETWLAERRRTHRETVQALRRLVAERADAGRSRALLQTVADRAEAAPDPAVRAWQQGLADYNCAFVARIHNSTTADQRRTARARLKGWAEDLRAVAVGRATTAPAGG